MHPAAESVLSLGVCENRDGWLVAWGFLWVIGFSFFHCVASPFHSFVTTRLPPTGSVLASLRLPACSSVHSWLVLMHLNSVSAPALLPAPAPVLHLSAPVRRAAVTDARLGLA